MVILSSSCCQGVSVNETLSTSSLTACQTTHLTSFAQISSPSQGKSNPTDSISDPAVAVPLAFIIVACIALVPLAVLLHRKRQEFAEISAEAGIAPSSSMASPKVCSRRLASHSLFITAFSALLHLSFRSFPLLLFFVAYCCSVKPCKLSPSSALTHAHTWLTEAHFFSSRSQLVSYSAKKNSKTYDLQPPPTSTIGTRNPLYPGQYHVDCFSCPFITYLSTFRPLYATDAFVFLTIVDFDFIFL
jgi:hypothetical protein